MTLELGGKVAKVVFPDAPVDRRWRASERHLLQPGPRALAGSRLLVHESVHDEVLASLRRRLATLRLGDPLDKNTDVGAINSAAQLAKILEMVEVVGEAEGAQGG